MPATDQLVLPLDVELRPTIAMGRGDSHVAQCSWCGLLACWSPNRPAWARSDRPVARRLGPCPACGGETWWKQADDPAYPGGPGHPGHMVGPFHRVAVPSGAPS